MSHSHNPFQYHSAFPTENSWPRKSKPSYSPNSDLDAFLHLLLHELAGAPRPCPFGNLLTNGWFLLRPKQSGSRSEVIMFSFLTIVSSKLFPLLLPWNATLDWVLPEHTYPHLGPYHHSPILIVLSFILGVFYSVNKLFHSSFLFLSPLWLISTSTWMTHQIPCPLNLHSFLPVIFSSAPC